MVNSSTFYFVHFLLQQLLKKKKLHTFPPRTTYFKIIIMANFYEINERDYILNIRAIIFKQRHYLKNCISLLENH